MGSGSIEQGCLLFSKKRVFYKAWFERFEFFIVWLNAVLHKMQVVLIMMVHWSIGNRSNRSLGWVEFEGLWSCETCVFHKSGWVFHKFTENGEFYIVWFLALTGIIETPAIERTEVVLSFYSSEYISLSLLI